MTGGAREGDLESILDNLRDVQTQRLTARAERLKVRQRRTRLLQSLVKELQDDGAGAGGVGSSESELKNVLLEESVSVKEEIQQMLDIASQSKMMLNNVEDVDKAEGGPDPTHRSLVDTMGDRLVTVKRRVENENEIITTLKKLWGIEEKPAVKVLPNPLVKEPAKAVVVVEEGPQLESAPPVDSSPALKRNMTGMLKKAATKVEEENREKARVERRGKEAGAIDSKDYSDVDPSTLSNISVDVVQMMRQDQATLMCAGQTFSSITPERKTERVRTFALSVDFTKVFYKEDAVSATNGRRGSVSTGHNFLIQDIKEVYPLTKKKGRQNSWEKVLAGVKSRTTKRGRRGNDLATSSTGSSTSSSEGMGVGSDQGSPRTTNKILSMMRRTSSSATSEQQHTNPDSPAFLKDAIGIGVHLGTTNQVLELYAPKRKAFVQWYDGLRMLMGLHPQCPEMLNEFSFRVNLKIEAARYLDEAKKFGDMRDVLDYISKEAARSNANINSTRASTRQYRNALYDLKLSDDKDLLKTVSVTHIAMLRTLYDDFWKQELENLIVQAKAMMNEMPTVQNHKKEANLAFVAITKISTSIDDGESYDASHVREVQRRAEIKESRYFQELVGLQPILDAFGGHIRELNRHMSRELNRVAGDRQKIQEVMAASNVISVLNNSKGGSNSMSKRREQTVLAVPMAGNYMTKLRIWRSFMNDIVGALA